MFVHIPFSCVDHRCLRQFFSCISASIAVVGHVINSYRMYNLHSPNGACILEALCSSFGELSLVLWNLCLAITMIISLRPSILHDAILLERIMRGFHIFVWTTSAVVTIVPWSMGSL